MKRCLTLIINREMQIRTTMRNYLIPIRMAVVKKSTNNVMDTWNQHNTVNQWFFYKSFLKNMFITKNSQFNLLLTQQRKQGEVNA